jgi:molybdenum cofactor biosynthesis enzyme MoaA
VIFEGRGDPLNNAQMSDLIKITKEHYSSAHTSITTHGSFPFKDWIAESELDVLRVSCDGAYPESYERYRIGAKLDRVLEFMRRSKASTRPAALRRMEVHPVRMERQRRGTGSRRAIGRRDGRAAALLSNAQPRPVAAVPQGG